MITSKTTPAIEVRLRGSTASIKYPAWADVKIDGEYCWMVKTKNGESYSVNKYGKKRSDWPAIECFGSKAPNGTILLAELYYGEGKNGALYDLLSHKESD